MTAENFCYWLKGYFEINDNQPRPPEYADTLNSEQIKMIKQHLDYVFTPMQVSTSQSSVSSSSTRTMQSALDGMDLKEDFKTVYC